MHVLENLIGDQKPLSLHATRNLGGLASGGCAEIQNILAGSGIQQGHYGHGAGFLDVVGTGFVQDMPARMFCGRGVESLTDPGNRFQRKRKVSGILEKVAPETVCLFLPVTVRKGLPFIG